MTGVAYGFDRGVDPGLADGFDPEDAARSSATAGVAALGRRLGEKAVGRCSPPAGSTLLDRHERGPAEPRPGLRQQVTEELPGGAMPMTPEDVVESVLDSVLRREALRHGLGAGVP